MRIQGWGQRDGDTGGGDRTRGAGHGGAGVGGDMGLGGRRGTEGRGTGWAGAGCWRAGVGLGAQGWGGTGIGGQAGGTGRGRGGAAGRRWVSLCGVSGGHFGGDRGGRQGWAHGGGLCWVPGDLPAAHLRPGAPQPGGCRPPPCPPLRPTAASRALRDPGGDPVTPRRICYDPAQLWPHPLGGIQCS